MNHFRQYVPGFVSEVEPEDFDFDTTQKLLASPFLSRCLNSVGFLKFTKSPLDNQESSSARDYDGHLMVHYYHENKETLFVAGYLRDVSSVDVPLCDYDYKKHAKKVAETRGPFEITACRALPQQAKKQFVVSITCGCGFAFLRHLPEDPPVGQERFTEEEIAEDPGLADLNTDFDIDTRPEGSRCQHCERIELLTVMPVLGAEQVDEFTTPLAKRFKFDSVLVHEGKPAAPIEIDDVVPSAVERDYITEPEATERLRNDTYDDGVVFVYRSDKQLVDLAVAASRHLHETDATPVTVDWLNTLGLPVVSGYKLEPNGHVKTNYWLINLGKQCLRFWENGKLTVDDHFQELLISEVCTRGQFRTLCRLFDVTLVEQVKQIEIMRQIENDDSNSDDSHYELDVFEDDA